MCSSLFVQSLKTECFVIAVERHIFLKCIFKAKETVFQTAMMFYGGIVLNYSTTASQNSPQGAEYNSDCFLVKGKKLLATEVIQFNKNSVMKVKSFCTELSGSHSWQTESWTTLQACNQSCIFVSWICLVSYLCFMRMEFHESSWKLFIH